MRKDGEKESEMSENGGTNDKHRREKVERRNEIIDREIVRKKDSWR